MNFEATEEKTTISEITENQLFDMVEYIRNAALEEFAKGDKNEIERATDFAFRTSNKIMELLNLTLVLEY